MWYSWATSIRVLGGGSIIVTDTTAASQPCLHEPQRWAPLRLRIRRPTHRTRQSGQARTNSALVCLFGSLSLVLSLFMLYVPLSHCFASFPQGLHRKRSRMLQAIACKISTEIGSFFFRLLTIFVTETHRLYQSNV